MLNLFAERLSIKRLNHSELLVQDLNFRTTNFKKLCTLKYNVFCLDNKTTDSL